MTAPTTAPAAPNATASLGLLPGFAGLVRKEFTEWRRGRRTWMVLLFSALFMTLASLNTWLQANVRPADPSLGVQNPIVDPTMNLVGVEPDLRSRRDLRRDESDHRRA